jgi:hypothetical protein
MRQDGGGQAAREYSREGKWHPNPYREPPMSEITHILSAIEQGDQHAAGQLLPLSSVPVTVKIAGTVLSSSNSSVGRRCCCCWRWALTEERLQNHREASMAIDSSSGSVCGTRVVPPPGAQTGRREALSRQGLPGTLAGVMDWCPTPEPDASC